MPDVGEVRYKATVDNSNLNGEIQKTESKLDSGFSNMEKTASSHFKGIGSVGVKVLKGIGTAFAGMVSAGAAGVAALTKMSTQSYGEYEQLVGGVDTLFKESSGKLKAYASEAYKTAGMSANAYMETTTSFAASLLQSLDGDTEKAVEYANRAVTDMSDNANKMGTDIASIQYAYQGFAKQNYTMLDNLKLGYGGTKEEMQRLVADAAELTDVQEKLGVTVDANSLSFGNIVNAISVVQAEMGITGTTAQEASETIEGSIASMSAAWENLTVGLADENADLNKLLNEFVESVETVGANLLPVIERILSSLAELLETKIPELITDAVTAVAEKGPEFVKTAVDLVNAFLQGIAQAAPGVATGAVQIVEELLNGLFESIPQLPKIAGDLITNLATSLAESAPELIPAAVECIMQFRQGLVDQLPNLLPAAIELVKGLAIGIVDAIPVLIEYLPELIQGIVDFLVNGIPELIEAVIFIVDAIVQELPTIIQALIDALPDIISALIEGLVGCIGQLVAGAIQLVVMLVTHMPEIIFALIEAIPQIVTAIIDGFMDSLPSFLEAGKGIMGAMKQGIEEIWGFIQKYFGEMIPNLINNIGEWFSEMPDRVNEWLNKTLQFVQDWASSMWNGAQKAGQDFINEVSRFIRELPGNVWKWLQNTLSKVSQFVSNFARKATEAGQQFFSNIAKKLWELPGEMWNIGSSIVSGIWNGIQSMAGWLWDQVWNFAAGILDGVKGALGIASPSKRMRDEVGKQIPPGIAIGIKGSEQDVLDEIDSLSGSIAREFALDVNYSAPGFNDIGRDLAASVSGNLTGATTIFVPLYLDGREIARASAWYMGEQLSWEAR